MINRTGKRFIARQYKGGHLMELKQIIDWALQENCSDIQLTVGTHIAVRKFGTLEMGKKQITQL